MPELSPRWNLDTIFPGGSSSQEFVHFLDSLEEELSLSVSFDESIEVQKWDELVKWLGKISAKLGEAWSFVHCLTAQDVKDQKARSLFGRVADLDAKFQSIMTEFDELLKSIPDKRWKEFLSAPAAADIAFNLAEHRTQAKDKMSAEQEGLVNDLSVDGYHAWGDLYDYVSGEIRIPYQVDGQTKELSVGQAFNKMLDPDRNTRREVFAGWEEAWSKNAEFCAQALNHLGGYRLGLYKHRGWYLLKEPLTNNRIDQDVLEAMWSAVEDGKDTALAYLSKKAELMGLEKLSWYDVQAPLAKSTTKVSYPDAAQFISTHFREFSPEMAGFAEMAFKGSWIEAEDRPGKRAGGFCTSFPLAKESRIFLTFDGSVSTVSTIAHELGHAYHSWVMRDLAYLNRDYPPNLAETASTLAEIVVSNAAVQSVSSDQERLALLDDKAGHQCVGHLMNIHARYLFELDFYRERAKGLVSGERLNELMLKAQREAFKDGLDDYHPHFWASKLHFYMTQVPFYNFPYTFGYLFSYAIYAKALDEGAKFAQSYVELLRDTGRMNVAELAQKHLGADIKDPGFWHKAVDLALNDVREFLKYADRL